MARIQRANVLLDVEEDEVDYYIGLGYNLLDEKGNVIRQAVPTDLLTLQKHFTDSNKKIAELESEIAKLKIELATEKTKTKDAEKTVTQTRKKKTEE